MKERKPSSKAFPPQTPESLDRKSHLNFEARSSSTTSSSRCHHETIWPLFPGGHCCFPRNDKHPPSIRLSSDTHFASSFALESFHLQNKGKQHVIRSFLEAEMIREARLAPKTLPSSDISSMNIQIATSFPLNFALL
jgi:hypothetical protein